MKLVDPTDFDILELLNEGRNVAPNVAAELEHDRAYINTRLPQLQDYGLVNKIGPATIIDSAAEYIPTVLDSARLIYATVLVAHASDKRFDVL